MKSEVLFNKSYKKEEEVNLFHFEYIKIEYNCSVSYELKMARSGLVVLVANPCIIFLGWRNVFSIGNFCRSDMSSGSVLSEERRVNVLPLLINVYIILVTF